MSNTLINGGMSCGDCVRSVTKSVQAVDRKAKGDMDLGRKLVRVNTSAYLEAVRTAITDAGYPVTASRTA